MASIQQNKEKKDVFRKACRCGVMSGMHFLDQCQRIVRRRAAEDREQKRETNWQTSQLGAWRQEEKTRESREQQLDREDEFRQWHETRQAKKFELLFTGKESEQLKRIKAELQEYLDIQKLVDAGKKMELELWQWRKLENKHEQNRRKQLEESHLLAMEAKGYKARICRDFGTTGSCRFGDECCFRHERFALKEKADKEVDQGDASTVASVQDLAAPHELPSKQLCIPEFDADVFSKDQFPVLGSKTMKPAFKPSKSMEPKVVAETEPAKTRWADEDEEPAKAKEPEVVAENAPEPTKAVELEAESELSNDQWWNDLASSKPTEAATPVVESFDDFLAAARLEKEKALFLENGFDSVDMLLDMSDEDMREIGLKLGHIKKLKACMANR